MCYRWASYGICIILKTLFAAEQKRRLETPNEPPNPFFVELVSALERSLVYCATGSARALHKGTLVPLLIALGLMENGFPALSNIVYWQPKPGEPYSLEHRYWPKKWIAGVYQPISSTFNGLRYHYNEDAALVGFMKPS